MTGVGKPAGTIGVAVIVKSFKFVALLPDFWYFLTLLASLYSDLKLFRKKVVRRKTVPFVKRHGSGFCISAC